jgi:enoyl-CoA hydratase/carnithine racemase
MALRLDIDGAVATITMDRPHQRNAFSNQMWGDLAAACETIAGDDNVRVVVLQGAGASFSAGGDFNDFAELTTLAQRQAYLRRVLAAYAAYERLPLPTIAAVDGIAVGGGCELAIVSDIVVATERARFGLPEGKVGLYPGVAVARGQGRITARLLDYLIYTGRVVDAETARQGNLVTLITPSSALDETLSELTGDIAAQAPLALAAAKRAALTARAAGGYQSTAEQIPELMTTADHAEGLSAFAAGRSPSFQGA